MVIRNDCPEYLWDRNYEVQKSYVIGSIYCINIFAKESSRSDYIYGGFEYWYMVQDSVDTFLNQYQHDQCAKVQYQEQCSVPAGRGPTTTQQKSHQHSA
jgi:hypothetical protein